MSAGGGRQGVQWRVVAETAALWLTYAVGMAIGWLVWPPLSLLYLAVVVGSNLLFMALICPYCRHTQDRNCHSGYHLVARLFPRRVGTTFARQFKRNLPVVYPVWAVPPLVAVYGLIRDLGQGFNWGLLAALALFSVFGFVFLPLASRKICAGCASAGECPRGSGRKPAPAGTAEAGR